MNKSELVHAVAEKSGMTLADTTRVVNATLEAIGESLQEGNAVQLVGFGTFTPKERAARTGRNPQTGAELKIPASKTVGFKVGKALKDSMNK